MTPAFPKRTVEEAERPLVRRRRVEVELAAVPKEVVGVNGKPAFASVPQESTPEVSALTSQLAEFKPETIRAVEEAVVAVIMVVEA